MSNPQDPTNQSSEDAGDEEEEEEDDDEEEEEPKLKYQRLGFSVIEILKEDSASCMAVHEKFLALGTTKGAIHILDFNGNEIKKWKTHASVVNEMSIDSNGEYISSCSDDGRVVVSGLYAPDTQEYNYGRPLSALSLDPDYLRRNTRQFCTGGKAGQVNLVSKGFMFFKNKDTVIHQGEGAIHSIKWRGPFIAWANDIGVKVYDCTVNQRITYINRPKGSPRPDLYRCSLCWENDTTLLIGWADSIKIGQVKERHDPATGGLPTRYVEIVAMFQTEYFISGLAPFGEYLCVLAYQETIDSASGQPERDRPELRIITRDNREMSSDALSIHNYENYKATDYRLDHLASESLFYIVSPKDIVFAKPRDLDDHISWLMDRKRYEEALHAAEVNAAQLHNHKIEEIGEKYVEHLLEVGDITAAANMCPKVAKRDAKLWEKWIFRFAKLKQLKAISPYIPVANPVLSDTVYEMVLNYFLNHEHEGFLRTISEWPSGLYNISNIITVVKEKLKKSPDDSLLDALAKLYTYDKQYDKTLEIYIRLKRGNVFELIQQHSLFTAIQDKVALLLELNEQEAVKLLVENTDRIPIPQVVAQLQSKPKLLHLYLNALFLKDAHMGEEFHELQVSLYATYDPPLLLPFLRQSIHYPLEKAYVICQQRNLYPEMVFILGRMGNVKEALKLLIDKIGDVKAAIEFVEQQKDDELWEDLITQCLRRPAFISGLLEHIGASVDPIKLIRRIPEGMEIIGLRDRLVKIISDYNLETSLREGCKEILRADCVQLFKRLFDNLRGGLLIEDHANGSAARCATCMANVISSKPDSGVVTFFCGHSYHQRCLKAAAQLGNNPQGTPVIPSQQNHNPNVSEFRSGGQKGNGVISESGGLDGQIWCTICMNVNAQQKGKRVLGQRK